MTIRSATVSDVPAIVALDPEAPSDPARVAAIESHVRGNRCWLAADEDEVLGYVVLDYSFYGQGFIPLLAVRWSSRRSGIGRALLRHATDSCAAAKLFTSTNESNTPMQMLLHQEGFVASGIIQNLDDGDPELVFFRALRK